MSIHTGKIGRLPVEIRDQLNQRLEAGEAGGPLVQWLNALPEVRSVLAAQFGGVAISEQNLSNWRAGGFLRWQHQAEVRSVFRKLPEDARAFGEGTKELGGDFTKQLTLMMTANVAVSARKLLAEETDSEQRFKLLRSFLQTLNNLQREETRAGRLGLERERQLYAEERDEDKAERQAGLLRQLEQLVAPTRRSGRAAASHHPEAAGRSVAEPARSGGLEGAP